MTIEDNGKPVCDMSRGELMAAVIWHDDEELRAKAIEAFLSHEHDEELRIMVQGYRDADKKRERQILKNYHALQKKDGKWQRK